MKNKHRNKEQEIKEELKDLSPFLYQMKEKEEPFKVPEGYFNQFQDQMIEQLKLTTDTSPKTNHQWNWGIPFQGFFEQLGFLIQPRMALALSSVLVILVAAWLLFRVGAHTSSDDLSFASLSIEEIQSYIDDNLEDFDEQTVKEIALDDHQISIIPQNTIDTDALNLYLDGVIEQMDPKELEELF